MIMSGKRFIAKIFGVSTDPKLKLMIEEKKAKEQKERILKIAMLSGSIRRVK